jgi:hypothetical protein
VPPEEQERIPWLLALCLRRLVVWPAGRDPLSATRVFQTLVWSSPADSSATATATATATAQALPACRQFDFDCPSSKGSEGSEGAFSLPSMPSMPSSRTYHIRVTCFDSHGHECAVLRWALARAECAQVLALARAHAGICPPQSRRGPEGPAAVVTEAGASQAVASSVIQAVAPEPKGPEAPVAHSADHIARNTVRLRRQQLGGNVSFVSCLPDTRPRAGRGKAPSGGARASLSKHSATPNLKHSAKRRRAIDDARSVEDGALRMVEMTEPDTEFFQCPRAHTDAHASQDLHASVAVARALAFLDCLSPDAPIDLSAESSPFASFASFASQSWTWLRPRKPHPRLEHVQHELGAQAPTQAPSAPTQAPSAPTQAPSAPTQAPSPSAPTQAPSPSAPTQTLGYQGRGYQGRGDSAVDALVAALSLSATASASSTKDLLRAAEAAGFLPPLPTLLNTLDL